MSAAMLLKIFSDCCLCFAVLGSGPVIFNVTLLLPALICGASAAIATFFQQKNLPVLRCICGVLPLCCLFFATELWQGILLAVPAVYTAVIIFRGKLELEYFTYRHFFVRSILLLAVGYLATNAWLFLLQVIQDETIFLDTSVMLRYGLTHILCGVVLQRQLRLGVGAKAAGSKGQIAVLLATAVVIVAGFSAAEPLLRKSIFAIFSTLGSLALAPFVLLAELYTWLISLLKSWDTGDRSFVKFIEQYIVQQEQIKDQITQIVPKDEPPEFNYMWFALIPLGIILLVAMVLFAYSFYKRRATADDGAQIKRVENVPQKKKMPVFSNRARVRQLYRDFLHREQSLGMKVKRNDTSESILRRIHRSTDRPSADQLRNIYLSARYDGRNDISRDQVEQAKQAFKNTHKK